MRAARCTSGTSGRSCCISRRICSVAARTHAPRSHARPLTTRRLSSRRQVASLPLAYAIPGNGIAEQVVIGGTLNFLSIYNFLVTGRILLSWFPQAQGIAALRPLYIVTDPFLNLFRGLGLNFGGIDFSVLPAFFLLSQSTNAVVALGAADVPNHLRTLPPAGVEPRVQPHTPERGQSETMFAPASCIEAFRFRRVLE